MSKLDELVTAVGALAEMGRLLRDELMKNGFSREETIRIVQAIMVEQFTTKHKEDD